MLPSWYPALVALHILAMVLFFSGTFLLLRAVQGQRRALAWTGPERDLLLKEGRASGRLPLFLLCWPSLVVLILTGAWMIWLQPALVVQAWIQAKLGLTALLFAYHLVNHRMYQRLRQGGTGPGLPGLQIWGMGAPLLLVVAVFLSTFKEVDWYIGVLGLVVLAAMLYAAVRAMGPGPASRPEIPSDGEESV